MDDTSVDDSEPFSASNGTCGALVLHGFTGSPRSMRRLAEAIADAGFSVELPRLPGHGTTLEVLEKTSFSDWLGAAEEAFALLSARSDRTIVVGHSMGGTVALHLALGQLEVAGLVLINPFVSPPAPSLLELLEKAQASGVSSMPTIGSDAKRPGASGGGYDATPIGPLLSLFDATKALSGRLGEVTCPVLLLSSRIDHVVPTESGDLLEKEVGGPIERVFLEESYHLAPIDNDAAEVEERAVAFCQKLVAS